VRTVLQLAYYFPPVGGAGAQRNLQLARHLPEVGYRPIVVTGPRERPDFRWTPFDDGLTAGAHGQDVHRVESPEPAIVTTRSRRWLRRRPKWEKWWSEVVVPTALAVGAEADVIHASLAPFMTANSAIEIARRLRKPLVLDLEDPWALDEMQVYPTAVHRQLELRNMLRVLTKADVVVMNTSEARARVLRSFRSLPADRVVAIPNAFDPIDFADPVEERMDGRFRIVHTGSLHTDTGLAQRAAPSWRRLLGGTIEGVDLLARSHHYLLKAIEDALARRPELREVIDVHLAGVFTSADREVAARYPFVRFHEFLPHDETIRLMRSADLLFLPLYDLPPGRRAAIVPHKTYEYVGSGRPILAALPEGDARDLLAGSGIAALCRPTDVAAMGEILLAEVDRWISDAPPRSPRSDVVRRCSCGRLVRDLATVYDDLVGIDPGVAEQPHRKRTVPSSG
jgi:glycosyltransferase involved in cell wall biosynthesis